MEMILNSIRWLTTALGPFVAGALLPVIATSVRAILQAREAQRLAAEAAFNDALNSDDLKKLSSYLQDEFGKVSLSMYLRDARLRNRLDRYLVRLTDFVAPPATEPAPQKTQTIEPAAVAITAPPTIYWQNEIGDPPQIIAALESVRNGESWNALARLRRDLEARFRAELMGSDPYASRLPMHKVPVPEDVEKVFRRFYRSASRAIHGEEVADDEVIQALQDARTVYRAMEDISPGWSKRSISIEPIKRRSIF